MISIILAIMLLISNPMSSQAMDTSSMVIDSANMLLMNQVLSRNRDKSELVESDNKSHDLGNIPYYSLFIAFAAIIFFMAAILDPTSKDYEFQSRQDRHKYRE